MSLENSQHRSCANLWRRQTSVSETPAKLLQNYNDESIFVWTTPPGGQLPKYDRNRDQDQWGLLAPWVNCFQDSRDIVTTGNGKHRFARLIGPTAERVKFPTSLTELGRRSMDTTIGFDVVMPFVVILVALYRYTRPQNWTLTFNCWKKHHISKLKSTQVYICHDSPSDASLKRMSMP